MGAFGEERQQALFGHTEFKVSQGHPQMGILNEQLKMSLEFKEAPEGHRGGGRSDLLESHRRKSTEPLLRKIINTYN